MRKGISQIISAVLLVAISVSIAGIYSEWAPSFAGEISREAADQSSNELKCDSAGFNIKNPRYDISGEILKVELQNTGTIRLNNDIQLATLNSSQVISQITVSDLEVGETELITLTSEKIPERLVGSSKTCPDLRVEARQIDVTE